MDIFTEKFKNELEEELSKLVEAFEKIQEEQKSNEEKEDVKLEPAMNIEDLYQVNEFGETVITDSVFRDPNNEIYYINKKVGGIKVKNECLALPFDTASDDECLSGVSDMDLLGILAFRFRKRDDLFALVQKIITRYYESDNNSK